MNLDMNDRHVTSEGKSHGLKLNFNHGAYNISGKRVVEDREDLLL